MQRKWIRIRRLSPGTVFGLAALVVALGGAAFAAIPNSGGVIHGCYQKSSGNLRVAESPGGCRNSERPLDWGTQAGGRMSAAVGQSENQRASFDNPPADPDASPGYSAQITTTSPGRLLITNTDAGAFFECQGSSPCHFAVGLYLDGQPLAGTGTSGTFLQVGEGGGTRVPASYLTPSVPAGTHTVSLLTKHDNGDARVGGDFAVTGPYDG
jgi:hypothetical protein